jgi:hypothetical protein
MPAQKHCKGIICIPSPLPYISLTTYIRRYLYAGKEQSQKEEMGEAKAAYFNQR